MFGLIGKKTYQRMQEEITLLKEEIRYHHDSFRNTYNEMVKAKARVKLLEEEINKPSEKDKKIARLRKQNTKFFHIFNRLKDHEDIPYRLRREMDDALASE